MPVTVTVEDHGFDRVRRDLERLTGLAVEAGLFDPEQAIKGVVHEFGTRIEGDDSEESQRIRPRPWLSVAADTTFPAYARAAETAVRNVCDGKGPRKALEPIANLTGKSARDVIEQGRAGGPPLKRSTIKAKGHARKLVDSGDMRDAIEGRIVDASEVEVDR